MGAGKGRARRAQTSPVSEAVRNTPVGTPKHVVTPQWPPDPSFGREADEAVEAQGDVLEDAPAGISGVRLGSTSFSQRMKCKACGTTFTASGEALDCGGFKADPNTFWFDGSAVAVTKFYVDCPAPGCDEITFIPTEKVPLLLRRQVYDKADEENQKKGWGKLPSFPNS